MPPPHQFPSQLASRFGSTGGLSFLVAGLSINLSAFAFHATASRALGPVGYGQLGPLLNLLQVLSLPLAAIQAAVTSQMSGAERRDDARGDLRGLTVRVFVLSVMADLVIVAAAPAIDAYLHFSSAVPLLLVPPWNTSTRATIPAQPNQGATACQLPQATW